MRRVGTIILYYKKGIRRSGIYRVGAVLVNIPVAVSLVVFDQPDTYD